MKFEGFSFGSIRIDGTTYEHDVVIDHGEVRKRVKKPSKRFREEFGHTPLSLEEEIPWACRRLVIGTGTGALPVMEAVKDEAKRRKIRLLILPTVKAIEEFEATSSRYQRNPTRDLLTLHRDRLSTWRADRSEGVVGGVLLSKTAFSNLLLGRDLPK